jgi:hypothetical protein
MVSARSAVGSYGSPVRFLKLAFKIAGVCLVVAGCTAVRPQSDPVDKTELRDMLAAERSLNQTLGADLFQGASIIGQDFSARIDGDVWDRISTTDTYQGSDYAKDRQNQIFNEVTRIWIREYAKTHHGISWDPNSGFVAFDDLTGRQLKYLGP